MRLIIFNDGRISKLSVFILVCLLVVATTASAGALYIRSLSALDKTLNGNKQSLIQWEISHFFDKWTYLASTFFENELTEPEKQFRIGEFFELVGVLQSEKKKLEYLIAHSSDSKEISLSNLQIGLIQAQIEDRTPLVEELLEARVTKVLSENRIIDEWGPVHWPPVDFTFESNGLLLMISPKAQISRENEYLLRPGLSLVNQIRIENDIEKSYPNSSALVIRIGGVATFPAQIRITSSLHSALNLISHEWLHHWLIFRPLGKAWFKGGELQSINETVANIFAEEIGDDTYELITGHHIDRKPWVPSIKNTQESQSNQFDFKMEMRNTRQQLESLLAVGRIEDSQNYLEARRMLFVDKGYNIRKLNNAWFAFYGSYVDSGASVSPIESQLRFIRLHSKDLRDFLIAVKDIDRVGQLETIAIKLGWEPNNQNLLPLG